ncbi:MAG: UDP-glucose/GDP-mannose dehydrogenase family protein [Deltaproteobacteria bacterium]|nr:UDP-glucose/GDP-mannose dehydrogenase family protein [Deltaproteobacteria bacterium]MBW1928766.1 UDP-glucose/GDP-mannose dehydrogenase family protein [Deltaproteobacteria bacterium]RLB14535.1 MAG: UDP-glucose 6-dehydrogenase [Deltaproteobacteria bacterium]
MNICMVGVGYVGLVSGTCFAEFGNRVICVDKDEEKIKALQAGTIPFFEPGLEELLKRNRTAGRVSFTTSLEEALNESLVVFIAVGTPSRDDGGADLSYVFDVAAEIGKFMKGYKVVVTKSTVPVGTAKKIREVIKTNQEREIPFDVVSNPEFLREGSAIEDFMRPNRVVIGSDSEQAAAIMKDLYSPLYLIETPFVLTNLETAEMIKYASNAFLATKISFINEMANICELVGADVHHVAKAMGLDRRIGPKFLHPGPGFGGSCFPKDTKAIAHFASSLGYRLRIVESVIEVNERQVERIVEKMERALEGLEGKHIGILGLTFKPNTDDIRESPAIKIVSSLLQRGARVTAYDPAGMEASKRVLKDVTYVQSSLEVAEGADALAIITEWNEFRHLDWDTIRKRLNRPVVFDLRNIYEPDRMRAKGFAYYCVGRGYEPTS